MGLDHSIPWLSRTSARSIPREHFRDVSETVHRVRVSLALTICSTGATVQVDEEAIREKWGTAVVNRVPEQKSLADKIRSRSGGEYAQPKDSSVLLETPSPQWMDP